MKTGLSRSVLTAVVSGALVAGGAVYTAPALAAGPLSTTVLTADESESPSPDPSVSESASESPSPEPSVSESSASPEPSEPSVEPTTPSASPTSSPTSSPTPAPDKVKPTGGAFKLSLGSLWIGQSTVFSQTAADYADNVTPDAQIVRKVFWGDGTSSTLGATSTTWTKKYTKNGTFKVYETLTDKAGNTLTTAARTVTVTIPGTYKLSKTSAYQGTTFAVNMTSVPAGTTEVRVYWGDGTYSKRANPRRAPSTGTSCTRTATPSPRRSSAASSPRRSSSATRTASAAAATSARSTS
ncbi:hypothetical protein [Actinoplanes sp. NBRC 101535]|uniref:hypothetical protein n=1 Tax=Actinoplanes sp. NBRC 101535 TaxID=3032196 RepID=UPI002555B37B|nr:hypothetical protein [Actinoplanes sp. NBRC 101535]